MGYKTYKSNVFYNILMLRPQKLTGGIKEIDRVILNEKIYFKITSRLSEAYYFFNFDPFICLISTLKNTNVLGPSTAADVKIYFKTAV